MGIAMTLEDTWGGDIATAAIAHLAHSTPPEFRFTSTDFNSYVTVSTAEGAPQRVDGRMAASVAPGLGIAPRMDVLGDPVLKMDGPAVFKLAVGVLEDVARSVLVKAGRSDTDIDWLIPHQANIRILQSTAKRLKLPLEKLIVTVDQHGNTSAASIPLALDESVRNGKIKRGDTVLLEGVGGGFTWGAVLLDF